MSEEKVRFSPYAKMLISGIASLVLIGILFVWLFLVQGPPRGSIMIWTGSIAPRGWAICDGTRGTPDLRGKFILSIGSGRVSGDIGGAETHTLSITEIPGHTHTGTVDSNGSHVHTGTTDSAGAHIHTQNSINDDFNNSGAYSNFSTPSYPNFDNGSTITWTDTINSNGVHTHTFETAAGGVHNHTFTSNSTGGSVPHNNMPPYYVLAYIMRL